MKKLLLLLICTTSLFAQYEPKLQFAHKQTTIGFGGNVYITNSTKDANGNLYYVGTFSYDADFDPSANTANLTAIGTSDVFIAKYDASGNYLWAKNIGVSGSTTVGNIAIAVGGSFFYLTGSYSGTVDFDPSTNTANQTSAGGNDIFMARYDLNGFYVLSKSIGGTGEDVARDIQFLNNQIVITGSFSETVDFDPSANKYELSSNGLKDFFLAKYSTSLVMQWAKKEGTNLDDQGKSIAFDSTGNILVAATQQSCTTRFDYWNGTLQVQNLSNSATTSSPAQATTNGNCNSLNITNLLNNEPEAANTNFVVAFKPTANTDGSTGTVSINQFITKKTILGVDYYCDFYGGGTYSTVTGLITINYEYRLTNASTGASNGNLWTGTDTISLTSAAPMQEILNNFRNYTYIKKYTNSGGLTWAKNIEGISTVALTYTKINVDSANNIFVTGQFNSPSDFDPSATIVKLTPSYIDGFISKYDSNGNYLWANKLGGASSDNIVSSGVDSSGNVFLIGNYTYSIDIDPSSTTTYTLNATDGNNFFARFDTNGNFIYAKPSFATNQSILVDNSNAVYLSGYFSGTKDLDATANTDYFYSPSTNNAFFSKYSPGGDYSFSKQLGNKPPGGIGSLIATDAQHNVYRAGNFGGTTDLDPSSNTATISPIANSSDVFIAKYNPNGGYVWGKTITGIKSKNVTVMNTDSNGNMYVAGYFAGTVDFDPSANLGTLTEILGTNSSFANMFIAKYDTNGNFIWVKHLSGYLRITKNIVFDANGNFYFQGDFFTDVVDIDPSPSNSVYLTPVGVRDIFFVKFDPQGNLLWAKSINGQDASAAASSDRGGMTLKGNELYLTGRIWGTCDFDPANSATSNLTSLHMEGYLAKYDLEGNYISAKLLESADASAYSQTTAVAVDLNNELYLLSYFTGTYDFDPSPDSAHYLTSPDGSLAISKINQKGSLVWVNTIPFNATSGMDWINYLPGIFVNSNNQLVLIANFWGALDFDPSATDNIVTSSMDPADNTQQAFNIVLAKYKSSDGAFLSANKIDGQNTGIMRSAVLDSNNDILMAGSFRGTANFDFLSNAQNLTSASNNYWDAFYVKYSDTSLSVPENNAFNSFVIYPNPTSDILHIKHNELNEFDVKLFDISGKLLDKTTLTNEKGIDVSSYPRGMYFIEVMDSITNDKNTYKFIKK